jgi:DNA anti-recombination protein RmuC
VVDSTLMAKRLIDSKVSLTAYEKYRIKEDDDLAGY